MTRLAAFNVNSCMVVAVLATIFVMQSTDAFRQMSVSKASTRLAKYARLNMAGDGDKKENSLMDILSGKYSKQAWQEIIWISIRIWRTRLSTSLLNLFALIFQCEEFCCIDFLRTFSEGDSFWLVSPMFCTTSTVYTHVISSILPSNSMQFYRYNMTILKWMILDWTISSVILYIIGVVWQYSTEQLQWV
jgi:hypothetical protein